MRRNWASSVISQSLPKHFYWTQIQSNFPTKWNSIQEKGNNGSWMLTDTTRLDICPCLTYKANLQIVWTAYFYRVGFLIWESQNTSLTRLPHAESCRTQGAGSNTTLTEALFFKRYFFAVLNNSSHKGKQVEQHIHESDVYFLFFFLRNETL